MILTLWISRHECHVIFHRFPSNDSSKNIPTSSWNCQILSKISCLKSAGVCPKTQTQLPGISRHFVGHNSLLDLLLWLVSEGKYKIDTFTVYLWFCSIRGPFFLTHALENKFVRRNNNFWWFFRWWTKRLKFHFNFHTFLNTLIVLLKNQNSHLSGPLALKMSTEHLVRIKDWSRIWDNRF